MPLAVRKVDHKTLWTKAPDGPPWLQQGELQADALSEIRSEENRLSIYIVNDDAGVTLERILSALAARRDFVAQLDYITFDIAMVGALNIAQANTAGETPDGLVNQNHIDLTELSSARLAAFGLALQQQGALFRKNDRAIGKLINISLRDGYIPAVSLRPGMAEKLKDPKFSP
jgi:hypothetical protein